MPEISELFETSDYFEFNYEMFIEQQRNSNHYNYNLDLPKNFNLTPSQQCSLNSGRSADRFIERLQQIF